MRADRIMRWNALSTWVTDTVAMRISFDETRCQGKPVRQRSMKTLISAMLGSKAREKPIRGSQAKR